MRQDCKTPLYKDCPVSKLKADIMLLEFKSTNGLSDKGFDQLLGVIRKLYWKPRPHTTEGRQFCLRITNRAVDGR
jgi:hypothetical protein